MNKNKNSDNNNDKSIANINDEGYKSYISLKHYRYIDNSCNRIFNRKEYKVERYTTIKPKICYHIQDRYHPGEEIKLNQSNFDAYIESEKIRKYYEKEEEQQEKFERVMHQRIHDKIKKDREELESFIKKELNTMKHRCICFNCLCKVQNSTKRKKETLQKS